MSSEITILVVDDGQENREFIVDYILKPNGFNFLLARNGQEGLDMARHHHPDLMLLDVNMPIMDGIQVLDALQAEHLDIPVILMTFHGSEEMAVQVYRKGVQDYVKKPYTVEEMYNAIERTMNLVRLRKERDDLTNRLVQKNAELNQRMREMKALSIIGKQVTSLMDINALMVHIVEAAARLTSCEEGSLFLIESEQIVCRAIRRQGDMRTYPMSEIRDDPLATQAIQSRQIVVRTPEELAEIRRRNPSAPSAAMATPLLVGNRPVGALVVKNVSSNARMFTRNDGELLGALADYAAIAYENASNYESMGKRKDDEKNHIRDIFARFVAPGVVESVLADPKSVDLGGSRRDISVMYADLRGYSTFAEKAPPEKVVEILNSYFSLVVDIVFQREGTLDKFMGDAVMAIFNAPTFQPDHVQRCVETALALQHAIARANEKRGGGLQFGIGLHVGEAVVGYMGAALAMTYTAIGDTVNITQRVQEAAQPGQVLVTEPLARQIAGRASLRQLGKLPLRGREKGILVFELLGIKQT